MASTSVTLTTTAAWESVEPDGAECDGCGEQCYLRQWDLLVAMCIDDKPLRGALAYTMCDTCKQIVEDAI